MTINDVQAEQTEQADDPPRWRVFAMRAMLIFTIADAIASLVKLEQEDHERTRRTLRAALEDRTISGPVTGRSEHGPAGVQPVPFTERCECDATFLALIDGKPSSIEIFEKATGVTTLHRALGCVVKSSTPGARSR